MKQSSSQKCVSSTCPACGWGLNAHTNESPFQLEGLMVMCLKFSPFWSYGQGCEWLFAFIFIYHLDWQVSHISVSMSVTAPSGQVYSHKESVKVQTWKVADLEARKFPMPEVYTTKTSQTKCLILHFSLSLSLGAKPEYLKPWGSDALEDNTDPLHLVGYFKHYSSHQKDDTVQIEDSYLDLTFPNNQNNWFFNLCADGGSCCSSMTALCRIEHLEPTYKADQRAEVSEVKNTTLWGQLRHCWWQRENK